VAGGLTFAEIATPARLQKLRRGLVPGVAVLAFFFFLLLTFPFDMVARRLEVEARRAGTELTIGSIGAHGLFGFRARDVRLKPPSAAGEALPELRFDRVDVSPDLFALLLRRTSFGFALVAYGGTATGHVALSSDPKLPGLKSLRIDASELDLNALPLKDLAGVDANGRISVNIALTSLQPPETSGGTLALSGRQLAVAGGTLQGFQLPRTSLGDVDGSAVVEKGIARVEKTQARGGDVDAEVDGTVRLRPLLSLSQADLHVRFRLADRWLNENAAIKGALGLIQNARQPDGSYVFTFTGPLSRMTPRPGR
jgi:type II secretion system protein N